MNAYRNGSRRSDPTGQMPVIAPLTMVTPFLANISHHPKVRHALA
jgi:hypothetical protein